MENIIYLNDDFTYIHTIKGELLNMNNKICMIETRKIIVFILN